MIDLPYKIEWRDYQKKQWNVFNEGKIKRFFDVWHRRAGKDVFWLNTVIKAALKRRGTYLYTFPKLNQARKVIWNGMTKEGRPFLDFIPHELINKPNKQEMIIPFKNGSILQLGGTDHYDNLRGTNPVAVVLSEFATQNPMAWDCLSPILDENDGWAAFVTTPHGTNHAYKKYMQVKYNPDWYCSLLTVDDTKRLNGNNVISQEAIRKTRESGMDEDMIQQEFYCSWTASVKGAYFAEQLRRMERQKRIKNFILDPDVPVITSWDLGIGDSCSIWVIQWQDGIPHAWMYYENQGRSIKHYINYLYELRDKYNLIYEQHYMPHDAKKRSFQTGKTLLDYAEDLNFRPIHKVPRCKRKIDAIACARSFLDRVVIHESNCAQGLSCLREYHAEYSERNGVYSVKPADNWASHGADAFMTYAQHYSMDKNPNKAYTTYQNVMDMNSSI